VSSHHHTEKQYFKHFEEILLDSIYSILSSSSSLLKRLQFELSSEASDVSSSGTSCFRPSYAIVLVDLRTLYSFLGFWLVRLRFLLSQSLTAVEGS